MGLGLQYQGAGDNIFRRRHFECGGLNGDLFEEVVVYKYIVYK